MELSQKLSPYIFVFKVLEGMPASFFQPVGEETVHRYNDMYQCNWGLEWSDYCLAYLVYICTVSMYNYSHPKFLRTAPDALQVINKAQISISKSCRLHEYFLGSTCRQNSSDARAAPPPGRRRSYLGSEYPGSDNSTISSIWI